MAKINKVAVDKVRKNIMVKMVTLESMSEKQIKAEFDSLFFDLFKDKSEKDMVLMILEAFVSDVFQDIGV